MTMRILHSTRNIVETDTLKATANLSLRVRAFSRSDAGIGDTVSLTWNPMLSSKQNHDLAAEAFVAKRGWGIDLIGYQTLSGFIYVNLAPDAKARTAADALVAAPPRKVPLVRGTFETTIADTSNNPVVPRKPSKPPSA